jgi:hypothetical protein
MQHKIAAHETRVSRAPVHAACRSTAKLHRQYEASIPCGSRLAAYPVLAVAGELGSLSGLTGRDRLYVPNVEASAILPAGLSGGVALVQELQLLTAKADLEQQVQKLKVQAEQKGVHLETGEDPDVSSLQLCRITFSPLQADPSAAFRLLSGRASHPQAGTLTATALHPQPCTHGNFLHYSLQGSCRGLVAARARMWAGCPRSRCRRRRGWTASTTPPRWMCSRQPRSQEPLW